MSSDYKLELLRGLEPSEEWLSWRDANVDLFYPHDFPIQEYMRVLLSQDEEDLPFIDSSFLFRMPSRTLNFVAFCKENHENLVPSWKDHYVEFPGDVWLDSTYEDYMVTGFFIDATGKAWVQFVDYCKYEGEWMTLESALDYDEIQVVLSIVKNGLVFHNPFWWWISEFDDIVVLSGTNLIRDEWVDTGLSLYYDSMMHIEEV